MAEELGDLLFVCASLARHLGIDAEVTLRRANQKFERRFRAIEDALHAEDKEPAEVDMTRLEELWRQAKSAEKPADSDNSKEMKP